MQCSYCTEKYGDCEYFHSIDESCSKEPEEDWTNEKCYHKLCAWETRAH